LYKFKIKIMERLEIAIKKFKNGENVTLECENLKTTQQKILSILFNIPIKELKNHIEEINLSLKNYNNSFTLKLIKY